MTAQGDLLSWVPYVKGSDTSRSAAESMQRPAETIRADVLAYIREGAATCDEVEVGLGLSHQTIGPRIRELVLMGKVRDSGSRRPTRSGRSARVFVVIA
jgi:predicted Rossmann fold nucleotide-binding protein DprA/Smf involved in DNA uptake